MSRPTIDVRFRPIDVWPGALLTADERDPVPFASNYSDTLDLLNRELDRIGAERTVIQLALREGDIRVDGLPRATARPDHPGVIVSFDSPHGPLKYATDRYRGGTVWRDSSRGGSLHIPGWQANLRAIALGLEALRKVDRYGITTRGEQYRGFAELPAGIPMGGPTHLTTDDARAFLAEHAGEWDPDDPDGLAAAYKRAAKRLHPDVGGDAELFQRLQSAKQLLNREVQ